MTWFGATRRTAAVTLLGLPAACDQAVGEADDAIDSVDDSYDTDEASDALVEGAEELATLTPPDDRRAIAQGLVGSLTEYADLVRCADDDPGECSQDQNALGPVISVQVASLDATCGESVYIEESNAWPDCVETFASEEPDRGQIVTEDESLLTGIESP